MKLAFVAVNYNNWHISVNYVASIHAIRGIEEHDVSIVIVDNCSSEADYAQLQAGVCDQTDIILVRTDKNRGYFGGLNYGFDQIDCADYDYVIAGNNDLFFERDFLNILKKKRYQDKQTVIVPDLETVNGVHQNPQYISLPGKKRLLAYRVYYSCYAAVLLIDFLYKRVRSKAIKEKQQRLEKATEIYLCTGGIMLFRPAFFGHCGRLDDSLFLWGEEVALAHQLVHAGDKMLYDPDLRVIHMENASVGKVASYKRFKIWKKSYSVYKDYYHI